MNRSLRITTLLLLTGQALLCSCAEIRFGANESDGTAWDSPYKEVRPTLFVNVHPSSSSPDLLPQTLRLEQAAKTWTDLTFTLSQSIEVKGEISGWATTPHIDISVPGEDTAVAANVVLYMADKIQSGGQATNAEDGLFTFKVPEGTDYILTVVPEGDQELPFYVETGVVLTEDSVLSFDVGYGIGVYGTVTDAADEPVSDVKVALVENATGTEGPSVTTDDDGTYFLRALPGSYTATFTGQSGSTIPRIEASVEVIEQDQMELNVTFGPLDTITVEGELADTDNNGVQDATVRFTSISLVEQAEGASLTVETDTDRNGYYAAKLLPGRYVVEYIPAYDDDISCLRKLIDIETSQSLATLNEMALPALTQLQGTVLSTTLRPAAGVIVTAQQVNFDGYTYSTTTDSDGHFELPLAEGEMKLTLTPADASDGAVTHQTIQNTAELPDEFLLAAGQAVSGEIRFAGEPVPYALVEINDETGQNLASALTDEFGAFAISIDTDMVRVAQDDEDLGNELNDTGSPSDTASYGDSGSASDLDTGAQ